MPAGIQVGASLLLLAPLLVAVVAVGLHDVFALDGPQRILISAERGGVRTAVLHILGADRARAGGGTQRYVDDEAPRRALLGRGRRGRHVPGRRGSRAGAAPDALGGGRVLRSPRRGRGRLFERDPLGLLTVALGRRRATYRSGPGPHTPVKAGGSGSSVSQDATSMTDAPASTGSKRNGRPTRVVSCPFTTCVEASRQLPRPAAEPMFGDLHAETRGRGAPLFAGDATQHQHREGRSFAGEGVAGAAPEQAGSTRVAAARNRTTVRAPGPNIGLLVPGAPV